MVIEKDKVSIVVPCYNSDEYIERFIESIINQSYKKIQLIMINDGSKDNTEEKIKKLEKKIKDRGIEFIYLAKKNGGAASAINLGLEFVNGEFLTWPDSDDILELESIEKRVDFLKKNEKYSLVRNNAYMVSENNLNQVIGKFYKKKESENIFEDLILENTYVANGTYLVRTKDLFEELDNLKIYESNGGQNWQLLLPITYKKKCGFIDEYLFKYVVRENSHSHDQMNKLEVQLKRRKEHKKILEETISKMKITEEEKQKYYKIVEEKYLRIFFNLYLNFGKTLEVDEYYKKLKNNFKLEKKEKIKYLLYKIRIYKFLRLVLY